MKKHLHNEKNEKRRKQIKELIKKTEKSSVSPKNKVLSKVQAFGVSSFRHDFQPTKEMTLGYFSVKEPFAQGQSCVRFVTRSSLTNPEDKKLKVRLKTDLRRGETVATDRESN